MRLPGGFSPGNLVRDIGDNLNPINGDTDYDIFGSVQAPWGGAPRPKAKPTPKVGSGIPVGGVYYDPATMSVVEQTANGPNALYTQQDGGGQQGSGTAARAAADPYAKWGGRDSFNNLQSGFNTQKSNIYGTSRESAENAALGRQSSILDFIQNLKTGQRNINERGVQNELGKRQGTRSILDMVGRGIRSGGVMLGGRNAGDSSAMGQVARAYGEYGGRQQADVNNQYELENRNIGIQQADFETQRATGLRKFDEGKVQTVNNIVLDARGKLAQLDAAMAEASMPERIAIEQEKEAIKAEALQILSRYDQQLAQGAQGVQPMSTQGRQAEAFSLANAGGVPTNPFDFSTQTPAQFQGTGQFGASLPIFTLPRRREV